MCGFAGELRNGSLADVETVARMGATLSDRGPDGEEVWATCRVKVKEKPRPGYVRPVVSCRVADLVCVGVVV